MRVDHSQPAEVEALARRLRDERDGRLDVLVNDVWGGDPLIEWGKPFWETPLEDAALRGPRRGRPRRRPELDG